MPEISYARPADHGAAVQDSDVAAVRAAFAQRKRRCRWEFIQDLTPDLPAILERNGFPACIPRPLMVVTPESFRQEQTEAAEIRPIERDEAVALGRMLAAAFGAPPEAVEKDDGSMILGMLDRGCVAHAAFADGKLVAGGLHMPLGGVTEVAGVGTHPDYRRRGLAGAVSASLVADAFAQGCDCVFLSAADETVQRVYARIGFELIGYAMDTMDP
jgi:ribosomal protein S18 acetylase RimI-like enzyme